MKSSILFFSFLVCLLPSFTIAFSDSTPLLGFASQLNHFLDSSIPNLLSSSTKSPVSYSNEISNALKGSSKKGLCEIDAVAIFQVQGLHSNSFRQSSTSSLQNLVISSPSHQAIEHVQGGDLAKKVSQIVLKECSSVGWTESKIQEFEEWEMIGKKKVINVMVDGVHDESELHQHLSALTSTHPNHLVLITSPETSDPRLTKRFEPLKSGNAQHGLFYKYQFFSTPILICLLVLLTVLLPPVYIALKMLAALQTPDKLGEKGRAPTVEKKNA